MIYNRYVTLFMAAFFAAYAIYYWNNPDHQFQVGLNVGFALWAFVQAGKDFAVHNIRKHRA